MTRDEEQLAKEATDEATSEELVKALEKHNKIIMNKQYPLYQYSIFLQGNRDEQLVIRTDTFEELIEAKKNIDKIIIKRSQTEEEPNKKSIPLEQFEETCEKCGAKKILSKKGNMVCSKFCWLNK